MEKDEHMGNVLQRLGNPVLEGIVFHISQSLRLILSKKLSTKHMTNLFSSLEIGMIESFGGCDSVFHSSLKEGI